MKKTTIFIIFCMLAISLTACSGIQQDRRVGNASGEENSQITTESIPAQASKTEPVQTENDTNASNVDSSDIEPESSVSGETDNGNILIAYFTYGENAELASDVDTSQLPAFRFLTAKLQAIPM